MARKTIKNNFKAVQNKEWKTYAVDNVTVYIYLFRSADQNCASERSHVNVKEWQATGEVSISEFSIFCSCIRSVKLY